VAVYRYLNHQWKGAKEAARVDLDERLRASTIVRCSCGDCQEEEK
jgi:hypothetical protein